jgi:hypothetical protein
MERCFAVYLTIPLLLTNRTLRGRMTDKLERVWKKES